MDNGTIRIVTALIRDDAGRVLLVRKRGTVAFMQPGGKRNPGEDDVSALSREVAEELGCSLILSSARFLGHFEAAAANEPGFRIHATLYAAEINGRITTSSEIEEAIWIDPAACTEIILAPLTQHHVMPLAAALKSAFLRQAGPA